MLFIAAEADPFVKVGGLGDVAGSLPAALKRLRPDLDIRLTIPFYEAVHNLNLHTVLVASFPIASKSGAIQADIFETKLGELPVYLIDGMPIEAAKGIYGTDFEMDAEKFIFFSLACLYLPAVLHWPIDILHANDWHTAIAVHELAAKRQDQPELALTKSILTLHNLPFMGTGAQKALQKFFVAPARNPRMPAWSRTLPLPMGINAADKIIAVSPTYANEILTGDYGCDLQAFLQTKKKKLSGILNGIDYQCWNPQEDKLIQASFSSETLSQRLRNKQALQNEYSLKKDTATPLLTFIGRMDNQKGVDLVIEALQRLHHKKWQAIFLGTGSPALEAQIQALQNCYPDQIRATLRFDAALSHRLYAGADILLMPSRYEPCGLAQMIAMHYGCIPVARATGGLVDTIQGYSKGPAAATGFLSWGATEVEFSQVVDSALEIYQQSEIWQKLQQNGMSQDFSWQNSAEKYAALYDMLT